MSTNRLQRTRLADAIAVGPIAVGRSHRLHRPRGGFCGRGYCQQCPLAGNEGLACEVPSDGYPPRLGPDPLRPLGWIGESMKPWFYERRFLRPRFARQPMLEVLRRLSAAHTLGSRTTWGAVEPRSLDTDVLVVGGGPSGIASAAATGAAGVRTVLLTSGPAGGRQPRAAAADDRIVANLEATKRHDVLLVEHTLCIGYYGEGSVFAAVSDRGPVTVRAHRVVVATGAYDRSLVVPGVDLPGVIGARAFERLSAQGAFSSRHVVGAYAAPTEASRIAEAARTAGLELAWVAGPTGPPDRGADTFAHGILERIDGRRAARGIVLTDGAHLKANVVVLGFTQPTYEIQVHLGQIPSIDGSPPIVRTAGPTVIPMLVVGEAGGDAEPEGADDRAARRVAAWLDGQPVADGHPPELGAVTDGLKADATVCICEDVTVAAIDLAIAEGFGDIELLKRRSGACTGACQGKLCLGTVGEVLLARGMAASLPTIRPPIRPVAIARLPGATA